MQEEMITLYHLRDWYGNVKQKRNNKPQSAIQQSVSQEATDAQCGNQGSPPARSLEIFFFRPTPDGSRQVVYQAGKTIALCKFTELMQ